MKRKVYCDYLRLVATFAVVFIHVAASNWSNVDVNGMQWQVFNIYDSLVRWGVPIFVMISGALFLNRDVPIQNIYSICTSHGNCIFIMEPLLCNINN